MDASGRREDKGDVDQPLVGIAGHPFPAVGGPLDLLPNSAEIAQEDGVSLRRFREIGQVHGERRGVAAGKRVGQELRRGEARTIRDANLRGFRRAGWRRRGDRVSLRPFKLLLKKKSRRLKMQKKDQLKT